MFFGFVVVWKAGQVERLLGLVSLSLVGVNWLSTVATIGDHRFRIPSMGMSLVLQVIGFWSLFIRGRGRLVGNSENIQWPMLHWRRKPLTDNLPS